MTTSQTVRALALIIAAQARIAGMQAANLDRQMQGYSLAYSEEAIFQEAGSLEMKQRRIDEEDWRAEQYRQRQEDNQ